MLTDFKGFNSVIYSTSYIAELCKKRKSLCKLIPFSCLRHENSFKTL